MKRLLAPLLVLACAAIGGLAWRVRALEARLAELEARREADLESARRQGKFERVIPESWEEEGAPVAPEPEPASGDPVADSRARVERLERELAEARTKLSRFDGMEPAMALVYAARPLREKLVEMAALPEVERFQVEWLLGQALGAKPEAAAELLELLEQEEDPRLLGSLAGLLRAGALRGIGSESIPRVLAVLREGQPAERRIAAAASISPGHWERLHPEWEDAVMAAVRAEPEPAVVGALARALEGHAMVLGDGLQQAFESAVERLPAGEPRREALTVLGKSAFLEGNGESLFDRWTTASDATLREEIAAALARCGNSVGGGGPVGGGEGDVATALALARARFLAVYSGTNAAATRRALFRAAPYGFGLMGIDAQGDAAFVADVAAREPDPARRDTLLRLADAVRAGATVGTAEWDAILGGE